MTMAGAAMARSIPRLLRDRRLAAAWFATQAVAIPLFWISLVLLPALRGNLLVGDVQGAQLWAFAAADATIVAASIVAAVAAAHDCRNAWLPMSLAAMAVAYPTAYFVALGVSGHGGELAATAMATLTLMSVGFAVGGLPITGRLPGRVANASSAWRSMAKTGIQLAVIWGSLVWLAPTLFVGIDAALGWSPALSSMAFVSGVGLLVGGGVVLGWGALHMAWRGRGTPFPLDAARALVTDGPYRFVRNPQVVGGLVQGIGLVLLHPTITFVAYVAGGALLWQVVLRPWEEADLLDRFGEPYDDYRRRVLCWRPVFRSSRVVDEASPGPARDR